MLLDDERFRKALDQAYFTARHCLLSERCSEGFWIGELSSSALATATAVSALSVVRGAESDQSNFESQISDFKSRISNLTVRSIRWLSEHQNADGGWGDTTISLSNISTTMLVRAAFQLAGSADDHASILERATAYIDEHGGAPAVAARYGQDRTFAVPILSNCALAGQAEWTEIASLPFELACLPHSWFRFFRLHVVSYALPALIAIGQLVHVKRPSWNLLTRWIRNLVTSQTLRKLVAIQPSSGGFLEAVPLTSFVTMSLAAVGRHEHEVVRRGVDFLTHSVRPDGSWPIDSNLSVWLTTLSVNALAQGPRGPCQLPDGEAERTRDWLIEQQLRETHSYTNAKPGGWGWSHLSGSVPDADDTSGAVLALAHLPRTAESARAADHGLQWLLDLQNGDGGWPTFCRGWGRLPFDRSGADLTAHALRALASWNPILTDLVVRGAHVDPGLIYRNRSPIALPRLRQAIDSAVAFLRLRQRPDGSWAPLWFGSQHVADDENRLYGTSKVLAAYCDLNLQKAPEAVRGLVWLVSAQNSDGGWGGAPGVVSSVEETALAVESLAQAEHSEKALAGIRRGVKWLVERVESGDWRKPSPIGLYFAKLWYFEKLYPQIFTVAALGRARRVLTSQAVPT